MNTQGTHYKHVIQNIRTDSGWSHTVVYVYV